jgi:hypothetical protein
MRSPTIREHFKLVTNRIKRVVELTVAAWSRIFSRVMSISDGEVRLWIKAPCAAVRSQS